MKWIIDNWSLLVVLAVIVTSFVISGKKSLKEWLLYAVFMAEEQYGSGTGKLKLRQVYDDFIVRYPILSKLIPFDIFSFYVDDVLREMRNIIETNLDIRAYITEDFDE